jgi:aryl-phospho-beta-D-glucosidase BglC (GH1 family)
MLDLHAAPGSQNGFDNSGETTPFKEPDFWGEHWLYDSVHMAATLITIEAMTTYINYIEDSHGLDNVMAFELLNEPWQMLDLGK